MRRDIGLSELVYEYLHSCILFERFPYGSKLPSIQDIARRFNVAKETVRRIFKQLEAEGLLHVDARKLAVVCYQRKPDDLSYTLQYFHNRQYLFDDVYQSANIVFSALMKEASALLDKADRQAILTILQGKQLYHLENMTHICLLYLGKLNNALIVSFFLEIIRYLRFPYLDCHALLNTWELQTAQKTSILILHDKIKHYGNSPWADTNIHMPQIYMEQVQQQLKRHAPRQPVEQIPFAWKIHRKHPQLCQTIAANILYQIKEGKLYYGEFLPSHSALVESLHVSNSTVRRALDLLDNLGFVETVQGKGRRLLPLEECREIAADDSLTRSSLQYFYDSFSFMAKLVKAVFLSGMQSDCFENDTFLTHVEQRQTYLYCEDIQSILMNTCKLEVLRECLHTLYRLQLWGLSLIRQLHDEQKLVEVEKGCQGFLCALRRKDKKACASALETMFFAQEQAIKRYMEEADIPIAA